MAQASGNKNNTKCAQFDNSTASKRQPPKALTYSFIKGHTMMLQTTIANSLETFSTQHVNLLSKDFQNKSISVDLSTLKTLFQRQHI
eukprot:12702650-Ditylum_brightwellii.AAC.1